MVKKALMFAELGVGVILSFMVWSYVSPHLSRVNNTPSA